ncbi:hypothetical protein RP20_CCG013117 [Aedes albopictus]|nr:hypothetical protein RP20_CCG013117 [Aedes albopictus]
MILPYSIGGDDEIDSTYPSNRRKTPTQCSLLRLVSEVQLWYREIAVGARSCCLLRTWARKSRWSGK